MKITAVLLKLGQTRVIISPMSPKITAKREKRARKRDYQQSLVFIVWTLEIVFKRQKTSAEGHSKTLSQFDLVFIHPGIYLRSMATVIEKSAKKAISGLRGRILEHVTAFAGENISVVWRQSSRKVPKSNFRPTWANSGACHSVCWRYIADFMKT